MRVIPGLTAEVVPLDRLQEHPRNARLGDVDTIADSLIVHGQFVPLVVQRSTGYVLDGNHRLQAMRALGWTEATVSYVDVDDDQAVRMMLVGNRSADLAGYDYDALSAALASLDGDLTGTGYSADDLTDAEQLLANLTPRDTQGSSAAEDLPGWEAKGMRTILLSYSVAQHDEVTAGLDKLVAHLGVGTYSDVVARLAAEATA